MLQTMYNSKQDSSKIVYCNKSTQSYSDGENNIKHNMVDVIMFNILCLIHTWTMCN